MFRVFAAAAVAVTVAGAAQATTLTIDFSATINPVNGSVTTVSTGDTITGTIVLDDGQTGLDLGFSGILYQVTSVTVIVPKASPTTLNSVGNEQLRLSNDYCSPSPCSGPAPNLGDQIGASADLGNNDSFGMNIVQNGTSPDLLSGEAIADLVATLNAGLPLGLTESSI